MDRRKALKGIGLSLGFMVATPTVLSILQSCQKDAEIKWKPLFFSKEESIVIQNLTDLILPSTKSSPGAIDVDIPKFLDIYFKDVESEIKQNFMKKGLQTILKNLGGSLTGITTADYDKLLSSFLRPSEKRKSNKEDKLIYGTLVKLRELTVWTYLKSEKIGKEFLAYDPVPGVQIGCISVEEATGGKRWSL